MDYDSDNSDTYADFSDEIFEELKENSQFASIAKFKEHIAHEPEFYGIRNISSFELLEIFKSPSKTRGSKKYYPTEYQHELFEDICGTIFSKTFNNVYYNAVANQIFNKIYV